MYLLYTNWLDKLVFFVALLLTLFAADKDYKASVAILLLLIMLTMLHYGLTNKVPHRRSISWLIFMTTIATAIGVILIKIVPLVKPILLTHNGN
jgi:uncharacterized membrane protein